MAEPLRFNSAGRSSVTVHLPSDRYKELEQLRLPCRDLMRGVEWMMQPDRAPQYLPRNTAEKPVSVGDGSTVDPWNIRRIEARLYNKFRDVVVDAAGRMFAKPVAHTEETPPALAGFLDDVDGMGTGVQVFGLSVALSAIAEGSHFVLVDFPRSAPDNEVRTEAQERLLTGFSPTWKSVSAANIIGWKIGMYRGMPRVEMVRMLESYTIPGGEPWDEKVKPQIRVFYAGDPDSTDRSPRSPRWARYEVWRKDDGFRGEERWVMVPEESGLIRPQVDIPLVEFATDPIAPFESIPPYLDIKSLVLAHFRKTSLLDSAHRTVGFPFLHWAGGKTDKNGKAVGLSPDRMVISTDPSAKFEFVEPSGTSWDQIEVNLKSLEAQIESLSDSTALSQEPGNITATGEAIRTARATAKLDAWALAFQDAFSELLRFTAIYKGLVKDDALDGWGGIEVNRVFSPSPQSAVNFEQRKFLYQIKALTARRMFQSAQAEGAVPEDADFEEEAREREAEGPDPLDFEDALKQAEERAAEAEVRAGGSARGVEESAQAEE